MSLLRPTTQYARSGDHYIAYQVFSHGHLDLVIIPGFISHLEHQWEEPELAYFLERLATFSRVITFDKRGTGMSGPCFLPSKFPPWCCTAATIGPFASATVATSSTT